MFEVITQTQPQDCQSLEILKEAYSKLARGVEVLKTSKRIAEAYVQLGQLSSAILEYETILQQHPADPDVLAALKAIEGRAANLSAAPVPAAESAPMPAAATASTKAKAREEKTAPPAGVVEDGRADMRKAFVDSKIISAGDFDLCWQTPDRATTPTGVVDPFIQILVDKGVLQIDKALKALVEKSRISYLPLDRYDIDADITRIFPADVCQRWCVLPFDRMSKSVLVATANPYNKTAARELGAATKYRLVFYLATPVDIVKNIKKVFRLP